MKKGFFLIILMAIGLAIIPAQNFDQAVQNLTNDLIAGKISMEEFERRMAELLSGETSNSETARQAERERQATESQRQQMQRNEQARQQAQNNWPNNTILNRYGIGSLTQPSGSMATFRENSSGYTRLSIELRNVTEAQAVVVINQLKGIRGIQERRDGTRTLGYFRLNNWHIDAIFDNSSDIPLSINVYDSTADSGRH
jgi:hypothetical protein